MGNQVGNSWEIPPAGKAGFSPLSPPYVSRVGKGKSDPREIPTGEIFPPGSGKGKEGALSVDEFEVIVRPWPEYGDACAAPLWHVRVENQNGAGAFGLVFSSRLGRFTRNGEFARLEARFPGVALAADSIVRRTVGASA